MTHNPLDHSYLLDINLIVHAELADKFYAEGTPHPLELRTEIKEN